MTRSCGNTLVSWSNWTRVDSPPLHEGKDRAQVSLQWVPRLWNTPLKMPPQFSRSRPEEVKQGVSTVRATWRRGVPFQVHLFKQELPHLYDFREDGSLTDEGPLTL